MSKQRLFWSATAVAVALPLVGAGAYLWQQGQPEHTAGPAPELAGIAAKAVTPISANRPATDHTPDTVAAKKVGLHFTDVTGQSGIDFHHFSGAAGDKLLPEMMGAGNALLDYDQDGDLDLLLINGTHWPWDQAPDNAPTLALYQNQGDWQFEDVTGQVGLAISQMGNGVAVGDVDNDGWPDIYLTALGKNRLLKNQQGRFSDITEQAGVAGSELDWSTSTGFFDMDNDGDLDLYVANYVQWSREADLNSGLNHDTIGRLYAGPINFPASHGRLYENLGDGQFRDISAESGIQALTQEGRPAGKGLGVTFRDADNNGYLDIYVANDLVRNFLFLNQGQGKFNEVGQEWGLAYDFRGKSTGGMGVDSTQLDGFGSFALAVGNSEFESSSLYLSQGQGQQFRDMSRALGITRHSRQMVTWGTLFTDFNFDGHPELFQANGHFEPDIRELNNFNDYRQKLLLYPGCGECKSPWAPTPAFRAGLGGDYAARGASYGDLDGDGDEDLLISQVDDTPLLLRNDTGQDNHWLGLRLQTASGRNAIGARVSLQTPSGIQHRQLMPTRSYQSQVAPELRFGLGNYQGDVELTVHWPNGERQQLNITETDQVLTLQQG